MTTDTLPELSTPLPASRAWTPDGALVIDAAGRRVVPVLSGDHPLGLYIVDADGVEWFPVATGARTALAPLLAGVLGVVLGAALVRRRQLVR